MEFSAKKLSGCGFREKEKHFMLRSAYCVLHNCVNYFIIVRRLKKTEQVNYLGLCVACHNVRRCSTRQQNCVCVCVHTSQKNLFYFLLNVNVCENNDREITFDVYFHTRQCRLYAISEPDLRKMPVKNGC